MDITNDRDHIATSPLVDSRSVLSRYESSLDLLFIVEMGQEEDVSMDAV
jgi:hypothetical protein